MNMPDAKTFGIQAETAFKEAVRKAIDRHRRLGLPIAFMENGKIIVMVPEPEPPTAPVRSGRRPGKNALAATERRSPRKGRKAERQR